MKLGDINGGGGNYLEAGTHNVFFHTWSIEETKKGKKYVNALFKDNDGNAHFEKFFITEKSLWRIRDLSFACGFNSDFEINVVPDMSIDCDFLQGKRLTIEIKKESYPKENGETGYNNVIKSFSQTQSDTAQDGNFQTSADVSGGDPF